MMEKGLVFVLVNISLTVFLFLFFKLSHAVHAAAFLCLVQTHSGAQN